MQSKLASTTSPLASASQVWDYKLSSIAQLSVLSGLKAEAGDENKSNLDCCEIFNISLLKVTLKSKSTTRNCTLFPL